MSEEARSAEATCSAVWEYRVELVPGGPMPGRELDTYGNDGWELCGMVGTTVPSQSMSNTWPNLIAYTFKRLKPNAEVRDAAPKL